MERVFADLSHEERRAIWTALNAGGYYLFTGSGISLDSEGAEGEMLSAGKLNDKLRTITDLGEKSSLQQNYSLLSANEIKDNITTPYTCLKPGETIKTLVNVPWKRVYTLNVDNSFEVYARIRAQETALSKDVVSVLNYNDLYRELSPDHIHSLVHLHGNVERSDTPYVFSHTEYARHMARPNSWMLTLTQLMKSEPFIVCGTSFDEIDVEYYLQQHQGMEASGDGLAVSVLIEPFPNRLTRRICKDNRFVLFEGFVKDFFDLIQSEFRPLGSPFESFGPENSYTARIDRQAQVLFEDSFERVKPSANRSPAVARFLLGAPLTWDLIYSRADIDRAAVSRIERDIAASLKSEEMAVVYLSDAGSGKSSLLRKVAFRAAQKYRNVYFYRGIERLREDIVADIFSCLAGDVIVFFDNVADSSSYLIGILDALNKENISFICSERIYRKPYLIDAFAEQNINVTYLDLDVTRAEATKLLQKNEECGLSDISQKSAQERAVALTEAQKNPIAIANCRIQNNFLSFDQIIRGLVVDSNPEELKLFILVALARYAYAGGVSKAVLHAIPGRGSFTQIDNIYSRFPIVAAPGASGYVVPARAAVSERVLEVVKVSDPALVLECMIELCNQLAPRVNRETIKRRTPEAKLTGGLMDFDRTVQRFINNGAEEFYRRIADDWDWNSRYWEQISLMKLSRFLEDQSDHLLLQESIQNARYAYSIDEHPLSLTTLAKTLFSAIEAVQGDRDAIFSEGWALIYHAIQIEKGWTRVKATAFIVAFKGVRSFVEKGGQLSGDQADEVREAIAITHQRKLRDKKLFELRDEVRALV